MCWTVLTNDATTSSLLSFWCWGNDVAFFTARATALRKLPVAVLYANRGARVVISFSSSSSVHKISFEQMKGRTVSFRSSVHPSDIHRFGKFLWARPALIDVEAVEHKNQRDKSTPDLLFLDGLLNSWDRWTVCVHVYHTWLLLIQVMVCSRHSS